jgi:hypothetical protein
MNRCITNAPVMLGTLLDGDGFLAHAIDGEADEQEVAFARKVLVPSVAAVAATSVAFGVAKACCGKSVGKVDPYGILPAGMAILTAAVALWSYLNPQPTQPGTFKTTVKRARQSL